jgi:hypothetical protein
MPTETWRSVVDYEGLYEVSDLGRVRSIRFRNRVANRPRTEPKLLSIRQASGYSIVQLCKDNRTATKLVHRLVLEAFVGPAPSGFAGAHQNGCRTDNRLSNLSWMSYTDNERQKTDHGTALLGERANTAKLTASDVRAIRQQYAAGATKKGLARVWGVKDGTIFNIVTRKNWKHVA